VDDLVEAVIDYHGTLRWGGACLLACLHTRISDFGFRISDFRFWILDFGFWAAIVGEFCTMRNKIKNKSQPYTGRMNRNRALDLWQFWAVLYLFELRGSGILTNVCF
jgi:hypothetical protein